MANLITTVPHGTAVDLDSSPQTLAYNGDGTLNYVTVSDGEYSYMQSYTYTSGKVTAISAWVQQ